MAVHIVFMLTHNVCYLPGIANIFEP